MKIPIFIRKDKNIKPIDWVVFYFEQKNESTKNVISLVNVTNRTYQKSLKRIDIARKKTGTYRNYYYSANFICHDSIMSLKRLKPIEKLILCMIINFYKNKQLTKDKVYKYLKKHYKSGNSFIDELKKGFEQYFNDEKKLFDNYYKENIDQDTLNEKITNLEYKNNIWFSKKKETDEWKKIEKIIKIENKYFHLSNNFLGRYFNVNEKTIRRAIKSLQDKEILYEYKIIYYY